MRKQPAPRIGVIGTGFVARHFVMELMHRKDYRLGRVLTRRPVASCTDFPVPDALTMSPDQLLAGSDIVFECTGDVIWATETIGKALAAGKPVVTLNPEFHVTTGSFFVGQGLLTEAEGDQPGCQASLVEEARSLTLYAAWCADAEPETLPYAAHMAKARASDSAWNVTAWTLQVFGGIGFTWEHDLQFLLKRAKVDGELLGSAGMHRDQVADFAGLAA